MSRSFIVITSLMYFAVAVNQMRKGDITMASLFALYAATGIPYFFLVE